MGDMVVSERPHQAALTTLLNEQMSLRGLRVTVLANDSNMFVSGFHRHVRKPIFKQVILGTHVPYLFHANWMTGREKQPALRFSRNWFVDDDTCTGRAPSSENGTLPHHPNATAAMTTTATTSTTVEGGTARTTSFTRATCCLAEPAKKKTE